MWIVTRRTHVGLLTLAALFTTSAEVRGKPANFMMRALVGGRTIEGQPLFWTKSEMRLLGRDGRLHTFDPSEAKESRKISPHFVSYTMPEMKQALYREFGKTSSVSTTQHFIVVHPKGEKNEWADRFEKLYRSFYNYFRVRGFEPQEPPYPLVVIVFRTEAELYAYAASQNEMIPPNWLGYYAYDSNRIALYDQRTRGGDWTESASTIIHEATHQTAYNLGIHTRYTGTPRWLSEGLAMMFEARGVYDHRLSDTRDDRLNETYLRAFKRFAAGNRRAGFMSELIASDAPFVREESNAYAEAWALTYFLAETRPRQYAEYLQRTADREMYADLDYWPRERLTDFQDVFHEDLKLFESQFLSYMKKFK